MGEKSFTLRLCTEEHLVKRGAVDPHQHFSQEEQTTNSAQTVPRLREAGWVKALGSHPTQNPGVCVVMVVVGTYACVCVLLMCAHTCRARPEVDSPYFLLLLSFL